MGYWGRLLTAFQYILFDHKNCLQPTDNSTTPLYEMWLCDYLTTAYDHHITVALLLTVQQSHAYISLMQLYDSLIQSNNGLIKLSMHNPMNSPMKVLPKLC